LLSFPSSKATVTGFSNFIKLSEIAIAKNPAEELDTIRLRFDPDSGRLIDQSPM
jgi:hypothetical protein